MRNFTHIHSSGLYETSPEVLRKAVQGYINEGASVITFTEVSSAARSRVLASFENFGAVTGDLSNRDDCGIMYDKRVWELRHKETFLVSNLTFFTSRGKPTGKTGAATVVLTHKATGRRILVTVCHLPATVEKNGRLAGLPRRVASWRGVQKGWQKRWNKLSKLFKTNGVLIVADWNLDLKKPANQKLFKAIQPGMKTTYNLKRLPGGTLRKRIIDIPFIRGGLRVSTPPQVLRLNPASDHNAIKEVLTIV